MDPKHDGIRDLAETLNLMDPESRERLLKNLAERDPSVAEKIREAMFTFEDVFKMETSLVQGLLRDLPPSTLAVALRGASASLLQTVRSHLSTRAQQQLQEEIDSIGPQPKSKVEEARRVIAQLARPLQQK